MSTFQIGPRLVKGALVSIASPNAQPDVIVFQYNPETLSRSLEPQTTGGEGGDKAESLRFKGAPVETIKVDIELDATDKLEHGEAPIGIHPQLAALELLVYPKSSLIIANSVLLALGTIEIIPPQAPLTLFVWGPKRVLPVRITEFSITEEAHQPNLDPIRAKVSLGMRVLSYSDLPIASQGYSLFLAHQILKETMAGGAVVHNMNAAGVGGA